MGDKNIGVITRIQLPGVEKYLLSIVEPKNFTKSNKSDEWVKSMNAELDQIEKNETQELVPRPEDKKNVGTNKFSKTSSIKMDR